MIVSRLAGATADLAQCPLPQKILDASAGSGQVVYVNNSGAPWTTVRLPNVGLGGTAILSGQFQHSLGFKTEGGGEAIVTKTVVPSASAFLPDIAYGLGGLYYGPFSGGPSRELALQWIDRLGGGGFGGFFRNVTYTIGSTTWRDILGNASTLRNASLIYSCGGARLSATVQVNATSHALPWPIIYSGNQPGNLQTIRSDGRISPASIQGELTSAARYINYAPSTFAAFYSPLPSIFTSFPSDGIARFGLRIFRNGILVADQHVLNNQTNTFAQYFADDGVYSVQLYSGAVNDLWPLFLDTSVGPGYRWLWQRLSDQWQIDRPQEWCFTIDRQHPCVAIAPADGPPPQAGQRIALRAVSSEWCQWSGGALVNGQPAVGASSDDESRHFTIDGGPASPGELTATWQAGAGMGDRAGNAVRFCNEAKFAIPFPGQPHGWFTGTPRRAVDDTFDQLRLHFSVPVLPDSIQFKLLKDNSEIPASSITTAGEGIAESGRYKSFVVSGLSGVFEAGKTFTLSVNSEDESPLVPGESGNEICALPICTAWVASNEPPSPPLANRREGFFQMPCVIEAAVDLPSDGEYSTVNVLSRVSHSGSTQSQVESFLNTPPTVAANSGVSAAGVPGSGLSVRLPTNSGTVANLSTAPLQNDGHSIAGVSGSGITNGIEDDDSIAVSQPTRSHWANSIDVPSIVVEFGCAATPRNNGTFNTAELVPASGGAQLPVGFVGYGIPESEVFSGSFTLTRSIDGQQLLPGQYAYSGSGSSKFSIKGEPTLYYVNRLGFRSTRQADSYFVALETIVDEDGNPSEPTEDIIYFNPNYTIESGSGSGSTPIPIDGPLSYAWGYIEGYSYGATVGRGDTIDGTSAGLPAAPVEWIDALFNVGGWPWDTNNNRVQTYFGFGQLPARGEPHVVYVINGPVTGYYIWSDSTESYVSIPEFPFNDNEWAEFEFRRSVELEGPKFHHPVERGPGGSITYTATQKDVKIKAQVVRHVDIASNGCGKAFSAQPGGGFISGTAVGVIEVAATDVAEAGDLWHVEKLFTWVQLRATTDPVGSVITGSQNYDYSYTRYTVFRARPKYDPDFGRLPNSSYHRLVEVPFAYQFRADQMSAFESGSAIWEMRHHDYSPARPWGTSQQNEDSKVPAFVRFSKG